MEGSDKKSKRAYHAPRREAAAARTREAIVRAAKQLFEERGWAGTTVRAIGGVAGVSQKTVEALFGTKAALLQAAVDYAIRGDVDPLPMPQRQAIAQMEEAAEAATMLKLHAAHLRAINQRSARLAWAVEHAASADPAVAALWQQMNRNRAFGVRWATETLLGKRGRKRGLTRQQVDAAFWVALDWGTYRTLTEHAGLTPDQFEQWLRGYYTANLLARRTSSNSGARSA
jgi:AcrR family transcriptional regulator